MAKNPHAVALGKIGGKAKQRKYGQGQPQAMGRSNRKPDDQVTPGALYRRDYRAGFRKRALANALKDKQS